MEFKRLRVEIDGAMHELVLDWDDYNRVRERVGLSPEPRPQPKPPPSNWGFTASFTTGAFEDFFRAYAYMPPPRTEHKTSRPPNGNSPPQRPSTKSQQLRNWLREITETPAHVDISDDKLVRRAKRHCHPDTGGSKELWLKLTDAAKYLGV